jgi:hypothetical protein
VWRDGQIVCGPSLVVMQDCRERFLVTGTGAAALERKDPLSGETPLISQVHLGEFENAKRLLQAGAHANTATGGTPPLGLQLCCAHAGSCACAHVMAIRRCAEQAGSERYSSRPNRGARTWWSCWWVFMQRLTEVMPRAKQHCIGRAKRGTTPRYRPFWRSARILRRTKRWVSKWTLTHPLAHFNVKCMRICGVYP